MNLQHVEKIQKNIDSSTSPWIFISLGFLNRRAHVFKIKNNNSAINNIQKEIFNLSQRGFKTKWIRLDFIRKNVEVSFKDLFEELPKIRRNYIDFGISFDPSFTLAFLPEEINANAFVRPIPGKDHQSLYICEKNINTYLKKFKSYRGIYFHKKYVNKNVIKFYTQGYLLDGDTIIELIPDGYMHGIRKVEPDDRRDEFNNLINGATNYLLNQVKESGRYEYGRFPHFDRKIGFYNILRHASSTYSLLEGLEYLDDLEGIKIAKKTLDYMLENYLYIDPEKPDEAYIFDDTNNINEIKLGQNGVALIALTKYMSITNSDEYLEIAAKIARGTTRMIGEDGDTIHVLNYPELTVKEEKRVIYYDGEAAFGLMRLYQQDKNPEWLKYVEILFKHFIENNYWKYSDHWLSYCTFELTKIKPSEKYYIFGLKNISRRLDYIYQRETTFPTFLEMLMAGYKMVTAMKESNLQYLIDEHLDEDKFNKTVVKRADYQRTGYFYPESAMYFKNPQNILHSFFIKHHGYRVRIDDVQHYISGYIQYMQYFNS